MSLGLDGLGAGRPKMLIMSVKRLLFEGGTGAPGLGWPSGGGEGAFVTGGTLFVAVVATFVCTSTTNGAFVVTTLSFVAGLIVVIAGCVVLVGTVFAPFIVLVFSKPVSVGTSFWTGKGSHIAVAQSTTHPSVHVSSGSNVGWPSSKLLAVVSGGVVGVRVV